MSYRKVQKWTYPSTFYFDGLLWVTVRTTLPLYTCSLSLASGARCELAGFGKGLSRTRYVCRYASKMFSFRCSKKWLLAASTQKVELPHSRGGRFWGIRRGGCRWCGEMREKVRRLPRCTLLRLGNYDLNYVRYAYYIFSSVSNEKLVVVFNGRTYYHIFCCNLHASICSLEPRRLSCHKLMRRDRATTQSFQG